MQSDIHCAAAVANQGFCILVAVAKNSLDKKWMANICLLFKKGKNARAADFQSFMLSKFFLLPLPNPVSIHKLGTDRRWDTRTEGHS